MRSAFLQSLGEKANRSAGAPFHRPRTVCPALGVISSLPWGTLLGAWQARPPRKDAKTSGKHLGYATENPSGRSGRRAAPRTLKFDATSWHHSTAAGFWTEPRALFVGSFMRRPLESPDPASQFAVCRQGCRTCRYVRPLVMPQPQKASSRYLRLVKYTEQPCVYPNIVAASLLCREQPRSVAFEQNRHGRRRLQAVRRRPWLAPAPPDRNGCASRVSSRSSQCRKRVGSDHAQRQIFAPLCGPWGDTVAKACRDRVERREARDAWMMVHLHRHTAATPGKTLLFP